MPLTLARRGFIATVAATVVATTLSTAALAQDKVHLRLSAVMSDPDQRAVAMIEKFGPAVSDFASFYVSG
jgi:TRAP-type transport system periplasmic protein